MNSVLLTSHKLLNLLSFLEKHYGKSQISRKTHPCQRNQACAQSLPAQDHPHSSEKIDGNFQKRRGPGFVERSYLRVNQFYFSLPCYMRGRVFYL